MAFLVLTSGLLVLLSFHGTAQGNNADTKIQAEAEALAEQKLNELASFVLAVDSRLATITAGPCPGVDATASVSGLTSFDFSCDVSGGNPRNAQVTVMWRDRNDKQRQAVVATQIRLSEPAQDAAGLITLVRAAETASEAAALWVAPDPADEGTDDEAETPGGDEEQGDSSEDDPPGADESDPPQELTLYTLRISGALAGSAGSAEIATVSVASPLLSTSSHCSQPTGSSFRCTVTHSDPRAGWFGAITVSARGGLRLQGLDPHGTGCGTSATLLFAALTENIEALRLDVC